MSSIVTGGDVGISFFINIQDGLIRQWSLAEIVGGLDDVNCTVKPLWTVSEHSLSITDLAIRSGSEHMCCC